jgi:hypothetical protein
MPCLLTTCSPLWYQENTTLLYIRLSRFLRPEHEGLKEYPSQFGRGKLYLRT